MKFREFLDEKKSVCNVCGDEKEVNKKGHCASCEEEVEYQKDKKAEKKNKKLDARY